MERNRYLGMDVHRASISIAVRDDAGKFVMECVVEAKEPPSWNSSEDRGEADASRLRKEPVPGSGMPSVVLSGEGADPLVEQ